MRAKYSVKRSKNINNIRLKQAAFKQYKKVAKKAYSNYKNNYINKLRKLKSNNPKEFWKYLKTQNILPSAKMPSCTEFFDHFSKIQEPMNMPHHGIVSSQMTVSLMKC